MPRRRRQTNELERVLGTPALFATAYGNVGSSIYYALGVTAVFALGLTPLVFVIAGLIFAATAATYAEGTVRYVLKRAGIERPPDLVVAATGDDEDNIVICQLARERYGVQKVVARVNDPRNQQHFDLLGIAPTVSATERIMALIEHEVPHKLVHLLELRRENLEIVEVEIAGRSPCVGKQIQTLTMPEGARLISVMRGGRAEVAVGSTELLAGDQVLAVLEPGKEEELRRLLLPPE